MVFSLDELVRVLSECKRQLFIPKFPEVKSDKKDTRMIEAYNGEWRYTAYFTDLPFLPQNEEISYALIPVWNIAYSGGMIAPYSENATFVDQVNNFLRKALMPVDSIGIFRGHKKFSELGYQYSNPDRSDLRNARTDREESGSERVLYNGKKVWLVHHAWELKLPK